MHTIQTTITLEIVEQKIQACSLRVTSTNVEEHRKLQRDFNHKSVEIIIACQSALATLFHMMKGPDFDEDSFFAHFIQEVRDQAVTMYGAEVRKMGGGASES